MGLGAPGPDPLCVRRRGLSVAWLLLGHLCQDPGVLREPREAGATELGGCVPFHLHIGLRLKTKLSDFRTFHSSKNNCTWGKTCRHFSESSSRFNKVPKLLALTGLRSPHTNSASPAGPVPRGPETRGPRNPATEEATRGTRRSHRNPYPKLPGRGRRTEVAEAETGRASVRGRGPGRALGARGSPPHRGSPQPPRREGAPSPQVGTEVQRGARHPFLGPHSPGQKQ